MSDFKSETATAIKTCGICGEDTQKCKHHQTRHAYSVNNTDKTLCGMETEEVWVSLPFNLWKDGLWYNCRKCEFLILRDDRYEVSDEQDG